ncbi:MAG: LysR family transcriptional regulator [Bdellovibrionales bacterium]
MQRINLNKLYYFFVVATEGSIKKASEKLHLTQPTISGQIKQLEEEMGVTVFKRSHRKIELNVKGRQLFKRCEKLFAMADEIQNSLQGLGRPERMSINIGAVQSMSNSFIFNFSMNLWKNEMIKISISQGRQDELFKQLDLGKIDILLTDAPPAGSKRYKVTTLGGDKLLAVSHPKFEKSGRFPDCLNDQPYVGFSNAGRLQQEINFFFDSENIHPELIGEVDDITLIRVIAQSTKCFTVIPYNAAKEALKSGELIKLGEIPDATSMLYAVVPKYSPKEKVIRQVIKDFFIRKR